MGTLPIRLVVVFMLTTSFLSHLALHSHELRTSYSQGNERSLEELRCLTRPAMAGTMKAISRDSLSNPLATDHIRTSLKEPSRDCRR